MDKARIVERLHASNPWWAGGPPEVPSLRRDAFEAVLGAAAVRKAVILHGLRQTGKTTLLLQLVSHRIADGLSPQRLLYLPLDDWARDLERGGLVLDELIGVYAEEVAHEPASRGEKWILLDEAHFHADWARTVKVLVDRRWPLRFVVTGSAGATLQQSAARWLAGRCRMVALGPMTLAELARARMDPRRYARVREVRLKLREGLARVVRGDADPWPDVVRWMTDLAPVRSDLSSLAARLLELGGFPEFALSDAPASTVYKALGTFLSLMTQKDFVEFFHVRDTKTLERLVRLVAQNTGRILVERRLASDLGVAIDTVRNHLAFLENAQVIHALRAFTAKASRAARLPEKFYFGDTGLRCALAGYSPADRGALLETLAYRHLAKWADECLPGARFTYWRHRDDEVDLVLAYGRRAWGIEVHAQGADRRGLDRFLALPGTAGAILVSDGARAGRDGATVAIPVAAALLLA